MKLIKNNFLVAIMVVAMLYVVSFALAAWDDSKASHGTLYTNSIESMGGGNIDLKNNLVCSGGGGIDDSCITQTTSVAWGDIENIPAGFSDGVDNVGAAATAGTLTCESKSSSNQATCTNTYKLTGGSCSFGGFSVFPANNPTRMKCVSNGAWANIICCKVV